MARTVADMLVGTLEQIGVRRSSVSSAIRSTRSPTRYDVAASIGSASATRRGRRSPPLVRRNSPGASLSAPVRPVPAARIW